MSGGAVWGSMLYSPYSVLCCACQRYVMVPPMLAPLSIALLSLSTLRDAAAFVPSSSLLRTGNSKHDLGREPDRRGRTQTAMATDSVVDVKAKVLQLAAVTDRGGMADPGVSTAYLRSKDDMRLLVESLAELDPVDKPITAAELSGRWELLYTTVELFRASPFFQMVEAGYDDPDKSNLFFKLHQLQTGSWGASSIGRITQTLDLIDSVPTRLSTGGTANDGETAPAEPAEAGEGKDERNTAMAETSGGIGSSGSLESEVDLIILPLTSIPLVGFWKLIPTFGGCIATKAKCSLSGDHNQVVELVVESTKLKAVEDVPLLPLAGQLFEGMEFPTGEVAKKVMGDVPVTKQTVVYVDDTLRVMEDKAGELYIYTRPL